MNRIRLLALAVFALLFAAMPAAAATIVRSYQTTLNFDASAPVQSVTFNFTLTYDPLVGFVDKAVDAYRASNALSSFQQQQVVFTRSGQIGDAVTLTIGGGASAGTQLFAVDDFLARFIVTATGVAAADGIPLAGPTEGSFVYAGRLYQSTSGITTLDTAVAPVPEPATWAMLLLGFAAAGIALRRRPRRVAATA